MPGELLEAGIALDVLGLLLESDRVRGIRWVAPGDGRRVELEVAVPIICGWLPVESLADARKLV